MEKVRFEQAVSGLSKNLLLDKRRRAFQTKQFLGEKAYGTVGATCNFFGWS